MAGSSVYLLTLTLSWGYWLTLLAQSRSVVSVSAVTHLPGLLGPMLAAMLVTAVEDDVLVALSLSHPREQAPKDARKQVREILSDEAWAELGRCRAVHPRGGGCGKEGIHPLRKKTERNATQHITRSRRG